MKQSPRLIFRSFFLLVILASLPACSPPAPLLTSTPLQPPTLTSIPTSTLTPTLMPEIYVSELTPEYSQVGFGSLGEGVYALPDAPDFDGKTIRAHGVDYPHGLMAHAPSIVAYQLNGQYRLFRTRMLVQDEMSCGDGVIFQVLMDGNEVYASTPVTGATEPQETELDVAGVQTLTLVADMRQAGDCDWAIWGDPVLVPIGGVAQNYPTATLRPTLTPNPDLPCNGISAEKIYLFLDCNDIRRIRAELYSGNVEFQRAWNALITIVDTYRANFPTSYNVEGNPALWWGSSNYMARDIALIYLVTGDLAYANDELRLLDLAISNTPGGRLLLDPDHGEVVYQSVLFGYLAVRDLPSVSEPTRASYTRFFIRQGQLLEAESIRQGNIPLDSWINRNVAMGENTTAATIALAFPDDPEAQLLYQQARPRLEWQLSNWIEQDGGWGENTNHYGFRVFEGILGFAEAMRKNRAENIYETDFGGKSIHSMCTYFLESLTPEGEPPQINDTGWEFFDPGVLMLCARRMNDPQIQFASRQALWGYYNAYSSGSSRDFTPFETIVWWDPAVSQDLTPPSWTSVLLPSTGLGIFRSDWSHEAQYGLLKYTASAVHTHFSFGEFFLYDHGPWLTGNGYHLGDEYNASVHTRSASTLTLDNAQQTTIGGSLIAFEPLGQTGYMAVTSPSYSILNHTRNVLWNQTWHQWIVVDDATFSASPAGHRLQVRWYVRGTEAGHDLNGNWMFTRLDYPGTLYVQMPSSTSTTYSPISRSYPYNTEGDAGGVEMEVAPSAPLARLISVLTYSDAQPASSPSVSRDDSGEGLLIVTQPAADSPIWDWLLAAPGTQQVEKTGYLLQGDAGCVWRKAAALAGYCLYTGTSLSVDDRLLAQSSAPISLEADIENSQITIDSSSDTTLQIYWPTGVQKITEDGQQVVFQQTEDVVSLQLTAGKHILLFNP